MFRPSILVMLLAGVFAVQAAEPHPSLPPPVIPDCLGVNIHFTDPKPGELEMLAAAGFKWVRMDFGWGGTERRKGEYDFSAYDRLVAALDKFKIRAVFILDYGNPLYADPGDTSPFTSRANTPEFRDAFGKWAVAAVRHFKGRGYLWEMWNEPNGGFWKSPDKTGDYIALAKSTGGALRQAGLLGPNGEAFIGPATSTIDLPYLEACFKAGLLDYWDAVSVHPYRQGPPESVEEEYRSVRMLIRKYAPKDKVIPIISGEWGYSSAWPGMGKDEAARIEQQGKYLPREFLTNIANDVALSIWYDWHEDGTDPKEGEHHFGIVGNEYHAGRNPVYDPKPAYTAMKTLNEQLAGTRFSKRLASNAEKEFELLFANETQVYIVAWQYRLQWPFGVNLLRPEAAYGVVNYLGKSSQLRPGDMPSRNIIDETPRYITPLDELDRQIFQTVAAWECAPLEFPVHIPASLVVETRIRNELSGPLPVDLQASHVDPQLGTPFDFNGMPEPKPGANLIRHQVIERSFPFHLEKPTQGQGIDYLLQLWPPGVHLMTFSQTSRIEVLNPLVAEFLPPTASLLPIQILNPSGEAVSATASWMGGGLHTFSAPLRLANGERETVVQFPLKPPVTFASRYDSVILHVAYDGNDRPFEILFGVPIRIPEFFPDFLNMANDGDREVKAEVSMDAGLPDETPPIGVTEGIRIGYRYSAGWKFCRLTFKEPAQRPLSLADDQYGSDHPRRLRMWLHGDGKGCQTRIRFTDSTGQTFQPDGLKIDWTGWRCVSFPMQPANDKPFAHWGGANDGKIHYPIKWDSIFLLDNVSRQPVKGEIYLSAPTLVY